MERYRSVESRKVPCESRRVFGLGELSYLRAIADVLSIQPILCDPTPGGKQPLRQSKIVKMRIAESELLKLE